MTSTSGTRKNTLASILFWSVISAAFIGPGTVTTASRAGAQFGAALIWAVIFSIIATLILQEAAARITITTGQNLGEHIRARFANTPALPAMIWFGIAFGCAAYESGNILGAVAGLQLLLPLNARICTVLVFLIALMLLRRGEIKHIARSLGVLVAVMGLTFIVVATQTPNTFHDIIKGAIVPSVSPSSLFLVIGLIGTTIVPYNLFLGSRLGKDQDLHQMRRGLTVAVCFGGLITVSILLAGTLVQGEYQFEALTHAFDVRLGNWAGVLFGIGLFSAGMTSAVTAPLAAAITAQSIFPTWTPDSRKYRAVWLSVLTVGLIMGVLNLKPIPVIIGAQVINGMLLPTVAIMLFVVGFPTNRTTPISENGVSTWHMIVAFLVLYIVTFLGLQSIINAVRKSGVFQISDNTTVWIAVICSIACCGLAQWMRRRTPS